MSIIERSFVLINIIKGQVTKVLYSQRTKTVCMHICQETGLQLDPQLFLNNNLIPVVEDNKLVFWGNI